MNKGRYRVIFNKATGVFAAVSELAKRHAKSTTSGEYVADVSAISGFFARFSKVALCIALLCNGVNLVSAQIVADPNAAQQPNVAATANNIPNVQIVAPNAAGVSHNQYQQFNVDHQGAILSNNPGVANTQLGGWIAPNPNLQHSGAAKVIVNEVTSTNKTVLKGYLEVAGQKADVVISNPNGIRVGNFGFINANRGVLTTGTPMFGGTGSLDAFRVEQGKITVEQGKKFEDSATGQTDLIARSVQVNGEITANQLNVVAGSNKVNYADLGVTVIKGKGGKPQVAIDVAVLGGMYANKINLVGTEAGVGVNNYGEMVSHVNNVQINSHGRVNIGGKTSAGKNIIISATGGIANQSGGVVAAKGDVNLASKNDIRNMGLIVAGQATEATANNIHNDGRVYGDAIKLSASGKINNGHDNHQDHAAGVVAAHDMLTLAANEVNNRDGALLLSEDGTLMIHGANGAHSQAAKVNNASGKIDAGSDLVINTKALNNTNTRYKTGEKSQHAHMVELWEGSGVAGNKHFTTGQAQVVSGHDYDRLVYTDENGKQVRRDQFTIDDFVRTTTESVLQDSKPGELIARGDISLSGKVTNDKSIITASGDIKGDIESLQNIDGKGALIVRDDGKRTYHTTQDAAWHTKTKNDYKEAGGIGRENSRLTTDLVLAKKTEHDKTLTKSSKQQDQEAQNLLSQIDSQLYRPAAANQGYLIETDPAFTNYNKFISSDYLLKALGVTGKVHLGDGFYEQKMVMEQVIRLTGRRDLVQGASTEEQYKTLMDAALTMQAKLNLKTGQALTQAQQKALSSDIVWMVSNTITLPNGDTTNVLSPVVYLAQNKVKDTPTTTGMLTARNIDINAREKIKNSGLIAADNKLVLTSGQDITNTFGDIHSNDDNGQVSLDAKGNINNSSASISGEKVELKAAKDINIGTKTIVSEGMNGLNINLERAGTVSGGKVAMTAGRNVEMNAANIAAANSLTISANDNLDLNAVTTKQENNFSASDVSSKSDKTTVNSTQIFSKGDVALTAGEDVASQAANVESNGALLVKANGSVNIGDATQRRDTGSDISQVSGGILSSESKHQVENAHQEQSAGSRFSGETVDVAANNNMTISGSEVVSTKDMQLSAGRDLEITTGRNVYAQGTSTDITKNGFNLTTRGVFLGSADQSSENNSKQVSNSGSALGSIEGNVVMQAGNHYGQTGSDVLAAKGNVSIAAKQVDITHATDTFDSNQSSKSSQIGFFGGVTGSAAEIANSVNNMRQSFKQTTNGRSNVMRGLLLASKAQKVADMVTGKGLFADMDASITFGASHSESHSEQHDKAVKDSSITAAGDVSITATGAGKESDLLIAGSDIKSGKNTLLKADNDVYVVSGQNTHTEHSHDKGSSASIGISLKNKGITASASGNRGFTDANEVKQVNSHINAGQTLEMSSGANTSIKGGVVAGKKVMANVDGNLEIASQQDTAEYDSKNQSAGATVTFLGKVGASVNAAQTRADASYAAVADQSGIKAGVDGFSVNVKGNTGLKGAVIASNDQAIKDGKNTLTTGTLTTSDIKNHDDHNVQSMNASVGSESGGSSFGYAEDKGNRHDSATKSGISGGQITITDEKAQQAKTMSGGSETVANINRDVTSEKDGNDKTEQHWSNASMQSSAKDLGAQAEITAQFGSMAAKKIGDFAKDQHKQLTDASEVAEKQGDHQRAIELKNESAMWAEGGVLRVLMHTTAGAITGDVAGAVGAMTSAAAMPTIGKAIESIELPEGVSVDNAIKIKKGLSTITATALGAAVGGGAGAMAGGNVDANNRQLHSSEIRLIGELAKKKAKEANCSGNEQCQKLEEVRWKDALERVAKSLVDEQYDEKNEEYLSQLHGATLKNPNTNAARGDYATYIGDLQEAYALFKPYIGKEIFINGKSQISHGTPQTFFDATEKQRKDFSVNQFWGMNLKATEPGVEGRDEERLISFYTDPDSVVAIHPEDWIPYGTLAKGGVVGALKISKWLAVKKAEKAGEKVAENALRALTNNGKKGLSGIDHKHGIDGDIKGNVNGSYSITGYHSKHGKGVEVLWESLPDKSDVTRASIKVPHPEIPGTSLIKGDSLNDTHTMYPKGWTPKRIALEVEAAWHSPKKVMLTKNKWQSTTPSGVKVEGFISPRITAYPVYEP